MNGKLGRVPSKVYELEDVEIKKNGKIQKLNIKASMFIEASSGQMLDVPGFNQLWHAVELEFSTPLNVSKKRNIEHVSFALPGKRPNSNDLIHWTIRDLVLATASTLKDAFDVEVTEFGGVPYSEFLKS